MSLLTSCSVAGLEKLERSKTSAHGLRCCLLVVGEMGRVLLRERRPGARGDENGEKKEEEEGEGSSPVQSRRERRHTRTSANALVA